MWFLICTRLGQLASYIEVCQKVIATWYIQLLSEWNGNTLLSLSSFVVTFYNLEEFGTYGALWCFSYVLLVALKQCFYLNFTFTLPLHIARWVTNHYKWIVWKLACYERYYPASSAGKFLTVTNVLEELKYRYVTALRHHTLFHKNDKTYDDIWSVDMREKWIMATGLPSRKFLKGMHRLLQWWFYAFQVFALVMQQKVGLVLKHKMGLRKQQQ